MGWGSEATFSPECTTECRDDKYKIAKWWCPVSKDRELTLYKWMHLNPESRAIETRKHRIARVHNIQAYLLDTIQIAIQNEHGNVGDRNTPMRCKRGENICPNHQVLHFSLYIWSGHYARNAWGLRPFDHQKYTVVLRPFSVMLRPLLLTFFTFCYFLLLFILFVTFSNYFLLLKVQCLLLFVTFFTACNFHKLLFLLLRTTRGII